jgi:hypothetical protein
MDAKELMLPDGNPSGIWLCSSCRKLSRAQDVTEACCRCSECHEPCPENSDHYTRLHRHCSDERSRKWNASRFEKATEVTECDGMVYSPDFNGIREGYFTDADEFVESYLDHVEWQEVELPDRPEFLFCTTPHEMRRIDIGDVLERMTSDINEDDDPKFDGTKELQAALDAFYQANDWYKAFDTDYTRKIRIPWPAPVVNA